MFLKFPLFNCVLLLTCYAAAQQAPPASPQKLQSKLDQLSGWIGTWHCDGKFVKSGAAISSTMQFSPALEGRWIEMHQDDLPPNRFHAIEFWGYDDKQSKFTATVFDNFNQTPRQFEGMISNGTLTFTRTILGDSPVSAEQFIFESSNGKLKVTYQVMRKGNDSWAIGDVLTCAR